MRPTELARLIQQGEGAKLEFKRDGARPESIAKQIVAFANMNGGRILVGVEDDGAISGVQKKNLQAWLMDVVIGRYVSPRILPDYQEVTIDGGVVAIIEVPMGAAKPYKVTKGERSDTYLRYGNVCRLADDMQMVRLFESGGLLSVERFPVHGSKFGELSELRYKHYFSKLLEVDGDLDEEFMLQQDFMVGEEGRLACSYFAYALFALQPGVRLPQAPLRVTVFPGADMDYETLLDETLDAPYVALRTELGAAEPAIQDRAIAALKPFISKSRVTRRVRERQWDYPRTPSRKRLLTGLSTAIGPCATTRAWRSTTIASKS